MLLSCSRVPLKPMRLNTQQKTHNTVNIYIRRLSDSAGVSSDDEGCAEEEEERSRVQPAKMLSASSTVAPVERRAGGAVNQVHESSDKGSRKEKNQAHTTTMQTRNFNSKVFNSGADVHISRFSADGREAVSAALKKRSQSAPLKRNVTVKLLDRGASRTPESLQKDSDPAPSTGDTGVSANVAAITAATIAATAPLIRAQGEMEAQISRVTAELKRLQAAEANAHQGRAGSSVDSSAERAAHLEEQLNALIQQRLQHLEMIQCQQIQLQNRLLGSALDVVTAHTHGSKITQTDALPIHISGSRSDALSATDKTTAGRPASVSKVEHREKRAGGHKSPLETPAPRKVIPKPTHWTSTADSLKPKRSSLKISGNGRLQDQIPNNKKSPERCSVQSVGVKSFAMATADDGQPEQPRDRQASPKSSITPTGSAEPKDSAFMKAHGKQENQREQICTASSSSAVQKANEMLQDLGRLKNEMRNLLQTADAFPVRNAESTQNSRSSSHLAPNTAAPPPPTTPISMPLESVETVAVRAVPLNRTSVLKSVQPPTSMFEDAGRVLRQVRQSKKVLEENLEAILRAKDGELLHTQLEALSKNRDIREELRIKKTVDAWINTLNKEIQDELARESSVSEKPMVEKPSSAAAKVVQQGQGSRNRSGAALRARGRGGGGGGGGGRGGGEISAAGRKTSLRDSVRAQTENTVPHRKQHALSTRTKPELNRETAQPVVLTSHDDEEYLAKLYGKAIYEGHRRTLKQGPYLRFNSPPPKSKTQRPKVIETVKGVKMKSSKTQTSQSVDEVSAFPSEPQYLFSPSDPVQKQPPGSPVRGYLIPMAIPLGKPRVDGQTPMPSRVIISDKPATVTTSFPPITVPEPKPVPNIRKPNTILLEVKSEPKKRTPHLEIQVQPGVNIESVLFSRPASSALSVPADTILPPPTIHATEAMHVLEDQDRNDFPGTNFLAVTDISQEADVEGPDSPIELNGLPSPAALYHGPSFPPQPSRSTPLTEPILSTIQQRETLENRLVDWVEQQLMARMITGMFPQPAQTDPASQSEPENSVTSDIVEAAGGGGLQLFVDAGVSVDSELIRQCVNEVLAETVAVMLGQRETQRAPAAPAQTLETRDQEVATVQTPVPTPEPSLQEAPSPVRTPDLSEHLSTALSPKESQHQESASPDRIPVDTPTATPIPSPTRVATPSPPPANQSPESVSQQNPPWGESELPLEEEEPHSETEKPQPIVMSEAQEEEEEEESIIPPSSPLPSKPKTPPVPQEPRLPPSAAVPDSPATDESSSSSSSSTDTVTETETAARHISEGELLLSHGQMAAARALEEEGVVLPNLMASLNSSLLGVQDMDYDPPSEGQVIRGPLIPAHHDPILSLLARMEHGPVSQSQQPERSWEEESSGEVSEGQRPLLTPAEERVLTGHSLTDQQRRTQPRNTEISPHATLTSPGEVPADHTGAVIEDSGLSINLRSTEEQKEAEAVYQVITVSSPQQDSEHQQSSETTQTVRRPAPVLVRQYHDQEEAELSHQQRLSDDTFFEDNEKDEDIDRQTDRREGGGSDVRVMSVRLPSVRQDLEAVSLSSVEGDTESSANDVF